MGGVSVPHASGAALRRHAPRRRHLHAAQAPYFLLGRPRRHLRMGMVPRIHCSVRRPRFHLSSMLLMTLYAVRSRVSPSSALQTARAPGSPVSSVELPETKVSVYLHCRLIGTTSVPAEVRLARCSPLWRRRCLFTLVSLRACKSPSYDTAPAGVLNVSQPRVLRMLRA